MRHKQLQRNKTNQNGGKPPNLKPPEKANPALPKIPTVRDIKQELQKAAREAKESLTELQSQLTALSGYFTESERLRALQADIPAIVDGRQARAVRHFYPHYVAMVDRRLEALDTASNETAVIARQSIERTRVALNSEYGSRLLPDGNRNSFELALRKLNRAGIADHGALQEFQRSVDAVVLDLSENDNHQACDTLSEKILCERLDQTMHALAEQHPCLLSLMELKKLYGTEGFSAQLQEFCLNFTRKEYHATVTLYSGVARADYIPAEIRKEISRRFNELDNAAAELISIGVPQSSAVVIVNFLDLPTLSQQVEKLKRGGVCPTMYRPLFAQYPEDLFCCMSNEEFSDWVDALIEVHGNPNYHIAPRMLRLHACPERYLSPTDVLGIQREVNQAQVVASEARVPGIIQWYTLLEELRARLEGIASKIPVLKNHGEFFSHVYIHLVYRGGEYSRDCDGAELRQGAVRKGIISAGQEGMLEDLFVTLKSVASIKGDLQNRIQVGPLKNEDFHNLFMLLMELPRTHALYRLQPERFKHKQHQLASRVPVEVATRLVTNYVAVDIEADLGSFREAPNSINKCLTNSGDRNFVLDLTDPSQRPFARALGELAGDLIEFEARLQVVLDTHKQGQLPLRYGTVESLEEMVGIISGYTSDTPDLVSIFRGKPPTEKMGVYLDQLPRMKEAYERIVERINAQRAYLVQDLRQGHQEMGTIYACS